METFGCIVVVLTIVSRVIPAEMASTAVPTTTATNTTMATTETNSPVAGEGISFLQFSLRAQFESSLSDPTSTAYQELAGEVMREVNKGFRIIYPRIFSRIFIRSFSEGSVIVNTTVTFHNQTVVPSGVHLANAMRDIIISKIALLDVDVDTISAFSTSTSTSSTSTTSGDPPLKTTITTVFGLSILMKVIQGLLSP